MWRLLGFFGAAGLAAGALLTLAACGDSPNPTGSRTIADRAGSAGSAEQDAEDRRGDDRKDDDGDRAGFARFRILDDCDPATFNLRVGPGTCVGSGKTTFTQFVAELTQTGMARKWRFVPRRRSVEEGTTLLARNLGGEVHTFTRVENFGGGIVPFLNTLSRTPIEAPECKTLDSEDFIPPGGKYNLPLPGVKDQNIKVQCCIHPWMRSTVRVD
ncbi:MAG: hypothetical protein M3068_05070 [Gemmatimonadota bacterium]|nr:hypothetical protein [Gemmatimonadota bacterium]MDQ6886647.1 hypothetical protein [Gemmatimonadota bacterium]